MLRRSDRLDAFGLTEVETSVEPSRSADAACSRRRSNRTYAAGNSRLDRRIRANTNRRTLKVDDK
jgi:hypothetical protein